MYIPNLHLPRVELHCKLQEKLHRVTGSLEHRHAIPLDIGLIFTV